MIFKEGVKRWGALKFSGVYLNRHLFEPDIPNLKGLGSIPPKGAGGQAFIQKTPKQIKDAIWLATA